jgi:DNA helicase HerA-like ATPase
MAQAVVNSLVASLTLGGVKSNNANPPAPAVSIAATMLNRHGLVAGATGTGKTVTLRRMVEQLSHMGVPTLMADVKGDLSGLAMPGVMTERIQSRLDELHQAHWQPSQLPVVFWDVWGQQGHPLRTTVSEMGPLLLGRLLDLTPAQQAILSVAFEVADAEGLLLLDLKDLKALLQWMAEEKEALSKDYGLLSTASLNALIRQWVTLSAQSADQFFGEPAIALDDWMRTTSEGLGQVNILAADQLIQQPKLYGTVLIWMLSELYESLPEVGDLDKPKLVVFFDEAHLMFSDLPDAVLDQMEQAIRLIRSKGVGIYMVTQNPMDIPEKIREQLSNRAQHALRAFSEKDQKRLKALAEGFPSQPGQNLAEVMTQLGVGEALVSTLDEKGFPTPGVTVLIAPPATRLGPLTPDERHGVVQSSPVMGRYETAIDRTSAYEKLQARRDDNMPESQASPQPRHAPTVGRPRPSIGEKMVTSTVQSIGRQIGRELIRGLFGALVRR